jgi:hypothetical protein
MIETMGIIGSIAYHLTDTRLRLVWIPMNEHFFGDIAKGVPMRTVKSSGWLEARRNRGQVETKRARQRRGYHQNKLKQLSSRTVDP